MAYYAVYKTSNKELVSVGSILASPFPSDLSSKVISDADYAKVVSMKSVWDTSSQTFTFYPPVDPSQPVTSSRTITVEYGDIMCDATSGNITLTLDSSIPNGAEFFFVKSDETSNIVTISLPLSNGDTEYNLPTQDKYVAIKKMGTFYIVRSNN